MKPIRIQLSRKKGWRKPVNTVVVARPSKFGNPYPKVAFGTSAIDGSRVKITRTPECIVGEFKNHIARHPLLLAEAKAELRGKNLACWCPLTSPCHADVLLEIANT